LILEVVAAYDLQIWHAFFRCPGSINDLNALDCSSVFQELNEDGASKCEYMINGRKYNIEYYLSDDIYPKWATFVKTICLPQGQRENYSLNVMNRQEKHGESVTPQILITLL